MTGIRPVAEWPKLLAGPMVRRVTNERAHIWVCTKMACEAQVVLHTLGRLGNRSNPTSGALSTGDRTSLERIGENLFIGVLSVDIPFHNPATPYVDGFAYDIIIHEPSTPRTPLGLWKLGLLGGTGGTAEGQYNAKRAEVPLGYDVGALPTFVLPGRSAADLRVVHASCRKPHGGTQTEPDALQLVDVAISQARTDPEADPRPQQLILTGDQIYADDVASGLLAALTEAGEKLLGWTERLPLINYRPGVSNNTFLIDPGWRTRYLSSKDVELKQPPDDGDPDYSQSHLLTFSEWAAMYIFAWSDALWPITGNDYDLPGPSGPTVPLDQANTIVELAERVNIDLLPAPAAIALSAGARLNRFEEVRTANWKETRVKALRYAKSLRSIRRVFANISTYMMFDDHEITDDWYLNKRMHDQIVGRRPAGDPPSPKVGRRILRNGLSAYAFFQHWGNVPDDFKERSPGSEPSPGFKLLERWRYDPNTAGCILKTRALQADAILDIGLRRATPPLSKAREDFTRMRWDYAIEFPAHRLVVIDTRTWRHFPTGEPFSWGSLDPRTGGSTARPGPNGGDRLEEIAVAWGNAGGAAANQAMVRFGGLIKAYVQLADAISRPRARSDIETRFDTLGLKIGAFNLLLHDLPPANPVSLVPVPRLFGSFSDIDEAKGYVVSILNDYANRDFTQFDRANPDTGEKLSQGQANKLNEVFMALAGFVEAAMLNSRAGMAYSARSVAIATDSGLASVFGNAGPITVPAPVSDLLTVTLNALDALAQSSDLDNVAGRLFRDGNNRRGAGLIKDDALPFMVTDPLKNIGPGKVTFLLSPAPIFGNRLVEGLQTLKAMKITAQGGRGEEDLDYEAWMVNVPAMNALFSAVHAASVNCVVVLSGDVHYGGSSVNDVQLPNIDNRSVDGVRLGNVRTRYIQLTSSSARNSTLQTRGLGTVDDLLFNHNTGARLITRQISSGDVEQILKDILDFALAELEEQLSRLSALARDQVAAILRWLRGPMVDPAELAALMLQAARDWTLAMGREGLVILTQSIQWLRDFADDPISQIFGDYLTMPDAMRGFLTNFVDGTQGLTIEESILWDRRRNRLNLPKHAAALAVYASDVTRGPESRTEDRYRRTVGHANVGMVSLDTRADNIIGLTHELRWYPRDLGPPGDPVPRTDWFGTLHKAGWAWRHRDPQAP